MPGVILNKMRTLKPLKQFISHILQASYKLTYVKIYESDLQAECGPKILEH